MEQKVYKLFGYIDQSLDNFDKETKNWHLIKTDAVKETN